MSAHVTVKRLRAVLAVVGVALVVWTCSDTMVPSVDHRSFDPAFLIVDGSSGGNTDIWFTSPLTDDPLTSELTCSTDGTVTNDPADALCFNDRPLNPNLAPVLLVQQLETTEDDVVSNCNGPREFGPWCSPVVLDDTVGTPLPMTFSEANGFYQAQLKDAGVAWDTTHMYRLSIRLGALEVALRDIDPDDGPPTASCTGETPFCQFNSGGAGNIPVKVYFESGAVCLLQGTDPNVCATASLGADGQLALTQGTTNLAVLGVTSVAGGGTATLHIQVYCDDLRDEANRADAAAGLVDVPTFGRCIQAETLDEVLVSGSLALCEVGTLADLTATQRGRATIHRWSAEDAKNTVALVHSHDDDPCGSFFSRGMMLERTFPELTPMERLARDVRRTWRGLAARAGRVLMPADALAGIPRPNVLACNRGCSSDGTFRSDFQVGLPVWMEHTDATAYDVARNLGTFDVGTLITGTVRAWDSGELEPPDESSPAPTPVPEAVANVRLTVTSDNGAITASPILTGSDGIATFELTVGPGLNTVSVSGIGVRVDGGVYGPSINLQGGTEADAVELQVGTLTFTAVGRVDLVFVPDPPTSDPVYIDGVTGVATIPAFDVCAEGNLEGVEITSIQFIKNNGDPVDVGGLPQGSTDGTFDPPLVTDASGCYTFDGVTIDKTGAYRIVINGEFTSQKINVKPPPKK